MSYVGLLIKQIMEKHGTYYAESSIVQSGLRIPGSIPQAPALCDVVFRLAVFLYSFA
jgi:hypothetical protein